MHKTRYFLILTLIITGNAQAVFGQNYISGVVSLFSQSLATGSTTIAPATGSLIFNGNHFFEQGNFINLGNSGAVSAGNGTLELTGTSLQTIQGPVTISSLRLGNAAGAVMSNSNGTMLTILDSVSCGNINNAMFTTNGLLTLHSTAANTARVADFTNNGANSGNNIAGDVIVERYIPSKRAWRLLGPPTVGAQTINAAWQEGATWTSGAPVNPYPGFGTIITKPDASAAGGYDAGVTGSTGFSLKMYTTSGVYTSPPNTDATTFADTAAYIIEIRGDRSVLPSYQTTPTPPTATTLRSRGALRAGNVTRQLSNANGNFAGISNPYPSAIDFSKLSLTNVTAGFYVWDTKLNTLGGWVYIDADDGYTATPFAGTSYTNPATNQYIQSGQGMLVKPYSNSSSILFKESNKTAAYNTASVFREGSGLPKLAITLYSHDTDSTIASLDGAVVAFDPSYSDSVLPDEDILKPGNIGESISFFNSGSYLMKEKRPLPSEKDTLLIKIWKTTVRNYRFIMDPVNLSNDVQAYLEDHFTNSSTPVDPANETSYDFAITPDSSSKSINRFSIVFVQQRVLPVLLTNLSAVKQNSAVNIQWKVNNESNVKLYEVERSADGRSFAAIGSVPASANQSISKNYSFLDEQPVAGKNFYRVKILGLNGDYTYTSVVNVTVADMMTIDIYPNPVHAGKATLLFANAKAGTYGLQLFNNEGKMVVAKYVYLATGTSKETLQLGTLAKGAYALQITDADHDVHVEKLTIIVE